MNFKCPLVQLMGEKKASVPFGSLVMNFKSINDITKKVPSLVSFITFIGSNDSLGGGKPYLFDF